MKKYLSIFVVAIALICVISLISCEIVINVQTTTTTNEEQPIDPPVDHVHTEEVIPGIEATCTETGLSEGKKCSECGKVLVAQQQTPLKAHTEEMIEGVEATCTKTGLSEGKKCSICDTILAPQQETPIITHTYDDEYDESCNTCGFVRDAECAHRETETIKGYEATCTSTGLTDGEKCKKCGEITLSQSVISLKNHIEVIDKAVDPTCTKTGLTQGEHCDVCGAIIVAQTVINAKGHSFGDWKTVKEPTTTEEGLKERYCECGEKECEEIPVITSEGLEYTLNSNKQSYSVTGIGTCIDIDISIPNTYNDLPVTSVEYKAFYNCDSLRSIIIPDNVLTIEDGAFANCDSLSTVVIGDGVVSIGDSAFINCKSISNLIIGASVKSIGQNAFSCCHALTSITIPNSVTSIGLWAFSSSATLTNIKIGSGVLDIQYGAFSDCASLANIEVDINNEHYKSIDGNLYNSNATVLIEYAKGKQDLSFVIPDGVVDIGREAFRNCELLTNIEFPDSLVNIGQGAFQSCVSLKDIVIPDGVKSIGASAFQGCISLTSIVIPKNVTEIVAEPFYACSSLKSIDVDVNNQYYESINGNLYTKGGKKMIQYAAGKEDTSFTIPNGVTTIGRYAFGAATSLTTVVIPNSVTTIEISAFYSCTSLKKIIIPTSVKNMDGHIFGNCPSITIYCRVTSQPSGWDNYWDMSNPRVVWGYTGN